MNVHIHLYLYIKPNKLTEYFDLQDYLKFQDIYLRIEILIHKEEVLWKTKLYYYRLHSL